MTTFLIIVSIVFIVFILLWNSYKKSINKNTSAPNTQENSGHEDNWTELYNQISEFEFPDRLNAIVWHINAIKKGFANNDLELVNLSYAKLIESIRQQNITEPGKFENDLEKIRKQYDQFREKYNKQYLKQFLPPAQKQIKITQNKPTAADKINFKSFITINNKAITDLQSFYKLAGNEEGHNREFWISERGQAELLAKIISVYSFSINMANFEILILKANKFLREMKKDKMTDYWQPYSFYKIEDLRESYSCDILTDLAEKLQHLNVGERLHFFDFASHHSFGKYWNGNSSSRSRNIGVDESVSIKKMVKLGLFSEVKEIESVPFITSKGELKKKASENGFELKKSWDLEKTYNFLISSVEGVNFLNKYITNKTILKFNNSYNDDLSKLINYQKNIKVVADLLSMI